MSIGPLRRAIAGPGGRLHPIPAGSSTGRSRVRFGIRVYFATMRLHVASGHPHRGCWKTPPLPGARGFRKPVFSRPVRRGSTRDGHRPSATRPRLGAVSFVHRFGSALNHHVHLHACATDGVFVPTGGGPPALLRASCLPKTVVGPVDHPGRSGHAHREGAPACRALVPHAAAHRRRCGQRYAPLGEQRVLGGRQRPDHALSSPTACLLSASRAPAAILCPAALRAGAALRDPRRGQPHRPRPLRAPATQGGQLGWPDELPVIDIHSL